MILIKDHKSEKVKAKTCFADKDLSSWTGKSRSGHDRSQSYGPNFASKLQILIKSHKIINKNIKHVNLEVLKIKTWFCDNDWFS